MFWNHSGSLETLQINNGSLDAITGRRQSLDFQWASQLCAGEFRGRLFRACVNFSLQWMKHLHESRKAYISYHTGETHHWEQIVQMTNNEHSVQHPCSGLLEVGRRRPNKARFLYLMVKGRHKSFCPLGLSVSGWRREWLRSSLLVVRNSEIRAALFKFVSANDIYFQIDTFKKYVLLYFTVLVTERVFKYLSSSW